MRKIIILLLITFTTSINCNAQKGKLTPSKQPISNRSILKDNIIALKSAIYSMKNYTKKSFTEPYLALAFDYQFKAIELYEEKNYESSIYHALKSRMYALMEIKRNKGRIQENHRVMPAKLFKYFEKEESFFVQLKDDLYNYDTDKMPSIDKYLDSTMKLSTTNPDIQDQTLIDELLVKSNIPY
ncbi:MAG: hypothetical protein H6584_07225 [Flavobacteriales bacterium]|nr:hypothetical protein [Flavobacteriales bacterium]